MADFHKNAANPAANPAEANLANLAAGARENGAANLAEAGANLAGMDAANPAANAANPAAKNGAVKKAAALAYKNGEVPRIAASGKNALAEAIIARAKAHGVPIFQNKELVEALLGLDLDEEIPSESYLAVARILVWLSEVEEKAQLSG